MIDGIIFDLDGTLWSAIDSAVKVLREMKEKYPEITREVTKADVESCMGLPFNDIVKIYYGYLPKDRAVHYAKEAFDENINNLIKNGGTLYPDLDSTIIKLSAKYKLFIVSNCVDGYIESFLKTSGLEEYFLDYECSGRMGLSKGENIELTMKRNHLKTAVYVGDTENDKEAASYAHIPFIYAAYGFGAVKEFDYKLDKISDLVSLMELEVDAGR